MVCLLPEDYFRNSCCHKVIHGYLNNLQFSLPLSIFHTPVSSQRSCFQLATLGFPFWMTGCEKGSTWLCAALSSPARHLKHHKLSVLPVPQTHRSTSTESQRAGCTENTSSTSLSITILLLLFHCQHQVFLCKLST